MILCCTLCLAFVLFTVSQSSAQGGDVLNEVPIWPVPAEMTLQEYKDANRRLNVGLVLMSMPLPGTLHFYADERREGWMHVGAAVLGISSIILGAAIMDEQENAWESSDFETIPITGASGKIERYEKRPIKDEGGVLTYRLKKLDRKRKNEGGGAAFIILGAGLVVGQLLHDWIDGVKTIERKRDAVRYKYGKSAGYKFSMSPNVDVRRRSLGAQLALRF